MSKRTRIEGLIAAAMEIEAEDARAVGMVGYTTRGLVQATLPHRRPEGMHYQRTSGMYTLTMGAAHPDVGLPYGSTPRLLLVWLATEAVRTQSREIPLGDSLSDFMRKVGLPRPTGGARGSITSLKRQARALFSCVVTCTRNHPERLDEERFLIADRNHSARWWGVSMGPGGRIVQTVGDDDAVTLSEGFYREVTGHAVPIDLRAFGSLRRSPMALDLYSWLTYRMATVQRPTTVPWESLRAQFGVGYPDTARGLADFRRQLRLHIRPVLALYPTARVAEVAGGVELRPSPTHIRPAPKRRRMPKGGGGQPA